MTAEGKKERFAKVISVYNRKGGVGKSYLSISLAGYLAKNTKNRVLYLDMDSQCDTSKHYLGLSEEIMSSDPATYKSLLNIPGIKNEQYGIDIPQLSWDNLLFKAPHYGLFTIMPSKSLDRYWDMAENTKGRIDIIYEFINTIRDKFDYIIINLGPRDNDVTLNALCASDYVLLATNPEVSSLDGIKDFYTGFWPIIKNFNPYCECLGLVINRYDSRSHAGFYNHEAKSMAEEYGFHIFESKIPNCTGIGNALSEDFKEAAKSNAPVLFFHPYFGRRFKSTQMAMTILIMDIIIRMETDQ